MGYLVTSGAAAKNAPAAIDEPAGKQFELADALAHACRLIDEQVPNVAIIDGNGRSISGDDLIACCRGDKEITPDLRAVEISN